MNDNKMIKVWAFYDAPEEYQKLSTNGGDEDWVALVPKGMDRPDWVGSEAFGCCDVAAYPIEGGTIHIGCHA